MQSWNSQEAAVLGATLKPGTLIITNIPHLFSIQIDFAILLVHAHAALTQAAQMHSPVARREDQATSLPLCSLLSAAALTDIEKKNRLNTEQIKVSGVAKKKKKKTSSIRGIIWRLWGTNLGSNYSGLVEVAHPESYAVAASKFPIPLAVIHLLHPQPCGIHSKERFNKLIPEIIEVELKN